jgi:hypothetical protein
LWLEAAAVELHKLVEEEVEVLEKVKIPLIHIVQLVH